MAEKSHFVVFTLDNQRFAIPLDSVEKIARSAEVRRLPKASRLILGVINVQGRIIPVIDLRIRFNLPTRPVDVTDHLIITRSTGRTVALLVDSVQDIIESDAQDITDQSDILDRMEYVQGVIRLENGLVLISDIERMLSADEAIEMEQALQKDQKRKRENSPVSESTTKAGE
jgi:purine-binding chemotaxis protein CheW